MSTFQHFKPYEGSDPYIFISYAHTDSAEVLPIVADMHDHGYNIWYDEGIEVGSEWQECIASHLVEAHLVISFISNAYMCSDNCRREMSYALAKRKKVINVFIQETQLTPGMEMQIGNIFALMKYTFLGENVFYEKLYSAPLLMSEDFSVQSKAVVAEVPREERAKQSGKTDKKQKKELRRAARRTPEAKRKRKKIVTFAVTLLVLGILIAGGLVAYFTGFLARLMTETKTVTELDGQTVAEFKESLFEAAAREYTGKADGSITVSDLKGMTALYICGDKYWLNEPLAGVAPQAMGVVTAEVTDWQGESVEVSFGSISDLSDLKYFTSLRTLWVQFENLNSLETLPVCAIEVLDVSACRVASLKGISDLPELRCIRVDGSSLIKLGDLNACLGLTEVSFVGGNITDYSVFKPLNKIRTVAFSNASTADIAQVLNHSSLRGVELHGCDLRGRFFNKFDNENALLSLALYDCTLESVSGIGEYAAMTELTVCNCTGIADYSELTGCAALKTVYADAAAAKELGALNASFTVEVIK